MPCLCYSQSGLFSDCIWFSIDQVGSHHHSEQVSLWDTISLVTFCYPTLIVLSCCFKDGIWFSILLVFGFSLLSIDQVGSHQHRAGVTMGHLLVICFLLIGTLLLPPGPLPVVSILVTRLVLLLPLGASVAGVNTHIVGSILHWKLYCHWALGPCWCRCQYS